MFPVVRTMRERVRQRLYFSRSDTFVVTTAKKPTFFRIDGAEPLTGPVPMTFHMWGFLMGINPDGSEGGLGGKPINLVMNGVKVWSGTTGSEPFQRNGWIDLYWDITEPGTYEFYVEFLGDAEWEGCPESATSTVITIGREAPRWATLFPRLWEFYRRLREPT